MSKNKTYVVSLETIKRFGGDKKKILAWAKKDYERQDQEDAKAKKEFLPGYPDCSDYGFITDPAILGEFIENYRLSFFSPDFRQKNAAQYKAAFDAVREMQTSHPELSSVNVPLADNLDDPTEKDFIVLAQCCTKFSAVLNAAAETPLAATEVAKEKTLIDSVNVALSKDESQVLNYLNQEYPTILSLGEITDLVKRDPKTTKKILDRMIEKKLLSHPEQETKGYIITTLGKEIHTKYYT
jgi:hypothetical protein